jgi:hypothetical protein
MAARIFPHAKNIKNARLRSDAARYPILLPLPATQEWERTEERGDPNRKDSSPDPLFHPMEEREFLGCSVAALRPSRPLREA